MTAQPVVPIVEGIFTPAGSDARAHLLISRCATCDALAFPTRQRCGACSGLELVIEEAPSEGSVHSWTTQPGSNPVLVVALVQLASGMRVQGYVTAEPGAMRIGLPVRTCLLPRGTDDQGQQFVSYAFEPAKAAR